MSFITRGTRAAARPLRQSRAPLRQSSRRNASSHDAHHDAPSGESALHVAGGAGTEGFGKGFYITIAAAPILYLAYSLSRSDNVVSRWAADYNNSLLSEKESRDILHAKALEQAISDRAVLYSEKASHVRDLRYTEFFNAGGPHNVAAGQGTADLSKLAEHYDQHRKRVESERLERMNASK